MRGRFAVGSEARVTEIFLVSDGSEVRGALGKFVE